MNKDELALFDKVCAKHGIDGKQKDAYRIHIDKRWRLFLRETGATEGTRKLAHAAFWRGIEAGITWTLSLLPNPPRDFSPLSVTDYLDLSKPLKKRTKR